MYKNTNVRLTRPLFSHNFRRQYLNNLRTIQQSKDFQEKPFFKFSLIHGIGQITERNIHPLERAIWILAVTVAVMGIVLVNLSSWKRFQENPIVISIQRDYNEWNTSFPALTLCPSKKINNESLKLMSKRFGSQYEKDAELFFKTLTESTLKTVDEITQFDAVPSSNYLDIILNVSFGFKYDIITSNLDQYSDDSMWMNQIFSELGVCYTFVSKIASYQELRNNPLDRHNIDVHPSLVGNPLEGELIIQIVNMNSGGTLFIHGAMEVPDIITRHSTVADRHYQTLGVKALSIVSSPEVSTLSLQQRKCQFLHEDTLQLRPVYTYNLCRMDCRMRLAHQLCGCVPHFYWGHKDNMYKLCDTTGLKCIARHKDKLVKLRVNDRDENCNCFPPCDDTIYNIDVDVTLQWFRGTNLKWGIVKYPKTRFKRDILFGITDLLVATGGSAGLFLGCSVLSFIEIMFCFLQPVFRHMRKYLQKKDTLKC